MSTKANHGLFVWHDLSTTDPKAAITFYKDVVGWTTQSFGETGPGAEYMMWVAGQGPLGSTMVLSDEVSGLDAAVARAKKGGGKVMNGPMEVPGGARIAKLMDPQGAAFALHEAKRK